MGPFGGNVPFSGNVRNVPVSQFKARPVYILKAEGLLERLGSVSHFPMDLGISRGV